ncbi:MAG: AmmeMemoRadiSam system protein B [Byssovorax sp.]
MRQTILAALGARRVRSLTMDDATLLHPKLRAVECVHVPDHGGGRALMLRDAEGIAPNPVVFSTELAPILARFDGRRSVATIAAEATLATGRTVEASLVADLAAELDAAWMLDSEAFRARRGAVIAAFLAAEVRPAQHAGGAYPGEATALRRYIEDECLAHAPARKGGSAIVGLTAPHMDLWRAAAGYGHAYRALADALPDDVDTLILLGTSHALMRRPFAVCAKAFATPLGALEPDREAIAALEKASRFDLRADEYLHKGEHSLEFQAVFLRHALAARYGHASAREPRIVPILCGLGEAQASGRDPALDGDAESFLVALGELVERRCGRVLVVAGADLAHVGPRFGDAGPLDDRGRERLAQRDSESIALAVDRDAAGFFTQVQSDLDTRRVCGLGPIYTMLRVLPAAKGARLHYAQHVDPDEGSIVSHASLAYYA